MINVFGISSLFLIAVYARVIFQYVRFRRIPGPFIAADSDLWRWFAMRKPAFGERMVKLHEKYGLLVRIGPNHISVSDPAAVSVVYSTNPVWEKAPSYSPATPVSNGKPKPSIITMPEAQHTAVRKVAGRAFTSNALLDYEHHIDEACRALVAVFERERSGYIDITIWFQYFAMDVINRVAFSDSLGFLEQGTDVEDLLQAAGNRFDHWNAWAALPDVEYMFMKSPLARLWQKSNSPLAAVAQTKMKNRMRSESAERKERKKDLLQEFIDGKERHDGLVTDDDVLGMTMSNIAAGADTTSATFAVVFYFLSKHSEVVRKLRNELAMALEDNVAASKPPQWTEVQNLPYLEAVLKEAMRIFPIAGWGLDRVVPAGGATIAGVWLPAGTVVGCQIDAIHRNRDFYGHDAEVFNPDRWIDASEEQRKAMDRAFLAFGAGKRICLGLHIAWLELKKLVPLLVMKFDIRLRDPDISLAEQVRPSAIRYLPPLWAVIEPVSATQAEL